MSDYKEEVRAAIKEALLKDACSLPSLAAGYGADVIRRGSRHYAVRCPFCTGKQKFTMQEFRGRWTFKCFKTSCPANTGGDAIEFLKLTRGLDNRDAVHALLEIAGIEHPWDRRERLRKEGGR